MGCVKADPNPAVALEATRVLVAVCDGQDKGAAAELIGGAVMVEVEGQTANLRALVVELLLLIRLTFL